MIDAERQQRPRRTFHRFGVVAGTVALTLLFFLVLPLMQAIAKPRSEALLLQSFDTANLPPPPPPPPPQEPEDEPEPEEQPPELAEDAPPLDLSQLELALNPGFGDGWMGADFAVDLKAIGGGGEDTAALFSLADLDQKPRVVYQPSPVMGSKVRQKAPGTVYIKFVVDADGRVESPIVDSADDPVFVRPALAAVKQWRFEPGKRNGQPVSFRMRVPITFPKP